MASTSMRMIFATITSTMSAKISEPLSTFSRHSAQMPIFAEPVLTAL
jgi:hypothetical protein